MLFFTSPCLVLGPSSGPDPFPVPLPVSDLSWSWSIVLVPVPRYISGLGLGKISGPGLGKISGPVKQWPCVTCLQSCLCLLMWPGHESAGIEWTTTCLDWKYN